MQLDSQLKISAIVNPSLDSVARPDLLEHALPVPVLPENGHAGVDSGDQYDKG